MGQVKFYESGELRRSKEVSRLFQRSRDSLVGVNGVTLSVGVTLAKPVEPEPRFFSSWNHDKSHRRKSRNVTNTRTDHIAVVRKTENRDERPFHLGEICLGLAEDEWAEPLSALSSVSYSLLTESGPYFLSNRRTMKCPRATA